MPCTKHTPVDIQTANMEQPNKDSKETNHGEKADPDKDEDDDMVNIDDILISSDKEPIN